MRLRNVTRLRVAKGVPGERPVVNLEDVSPFGGKLAGNLRWASAGDLCAFEPGDVLFSKLRPYLAKTCLVDIPLFGTGEFLCLVPGTGIDSRFLAYHTLSRPWLDWSVATSYGTKMPRTSWDAIAEYHLHVPEVPEQRRIADFLDEQTAWANNIHALRNQQKHLIEERSLTALGFLYGDQRPDRRRVPLKALLSQSPRYGVLVPEFVEDGVPFIRVNDLAALESPKIPASSISVRQSAEYLRTVVAAGDVLTSVVGTLGKSAIVPEEAVGANVARAVCKLRPASGISPWFLRGWLATSQFLTSAERATGSGAAQATLNMRDLANFSIALPTDGDAQAVGIKARELLAELRHAQTSLERLNRLLSERKQALITAAVTGQFDVTTARSVSV